MPASSIAPRVAAWQLRMANLPGPPMGQEALTVTFPTTDLTIRVLLALGADLSALPSTWAWQDITEFVRFDPGIEIVRGRAETESIATDQMRLKLDQSDGRFARRNATSPYYGLLSMNTPIWVTVDAGSGVRTRAEMFVNSWPARWTDKSGNDCTVTIDCAGVLRRLVQGESLQSPLRRSILADDPTFYWPMEDGTGAALGASGLPSGVPLITSGTVNWATDDGPAGSLPLPGQLLDDSGALLGFVEMSTTSTYQVELVAKIDPAASGGSLVRWTSLGDSTLAAWNISYVSDGEALQVDTVDSTGVVSTRVGVFDPNDGEFHHIVVKVAQNGTGTDITLYYDGALSTSTTVASTTVYAPRYPRIALDSFSAPSAGPVAMGHLAFHAHGNDLTGHYDAMLGYDGEMAHVRLARLCAEIGIPFVCLASASVAMGPQPIDALAPILRECESTDMGVLYETGWGLGYQATSQRYNAAVGMTLDFDLGQIAETPEPADDDLLVRNKWTISRSGGSEYTAAQDAAGPMGTGAGGPGVYDDQKTVNVSTDNQLSSQAGWRGHLGTVDEDRWSRLVINLVRNPGLIDTWTSLPPSGARLNVLHPPDEVSPETIDAFIQGYGERFNTKSWGAALITVPASPYEVHVVADTSGNRGRVDAANSTLAADATAVATTISVASSGALWRTGAVNFDIGVGGERMTVTNISGGSSPQTFTVTRSVNAVVKAQPSTVGGRAMKVSLWRPGVYAL